MIFPLMVTHLPLQRKTNHTSQQTPKTFRYTQIAFLRTGGVIQLQGGDCTSAIDTDISCVSPADAVTLPLSSMNSRYLSPSSKDRIRQVSIYTFHALLNLSHMSRLYVSDPEFGLPPNQRKEYGW